MSHEMPPDDGPVFGPEDDMPPPPPARLPERRREAPPAELVITCGACGATERRPVQGRELGPALLAQVRSEVREAMMLDGHAAGAEPPHCPHTERALIAAALVGYWSEASNAVTGKHFISPFLGAVWDVTRQMYPRGTRPELHKIAARLEADGACRAEAAIPRLEELAGPGEFAANDPVTVARLIELAAQRDLLLDALAFVEVIRANVSAEELYVRLRTMRDKVNAMRGKGSAPVDTTSLLGRLEEAR